MISYRQFAVLIAVATLVLASAIAQEEAPGQPALAGAKLAIVDIGAISDEYRALQDKDASLKAWLVERVGYLESLQNYVFLSEDNFNEVLMIVDLPRPIPAENVERLDELEALSLQKEQRFRELESKSPRTTEEADEFSMLREGFRGRQQQIQQLETGINQQYQQQVEQARQQLMRNVEQAITEYAQQHGYDLVLDHAFVLYGGDDITRAVIDKLNPPAAGESPGSEEAEAPETPPTEQPAAEESSAEPPTESQ